jgi:DNA primase
LSVYDDDFLREINSKVDLLNYVSQQIKLERKGNDYFGSCPLHVDLTPSFSITPAKNSYYCFSCGKGGYIIGYLVDFEGLSFDKAVEKAAKLADLDMGKMCQSPTVSYLRKIKQSRIYPEQISHEILSESEYEQYSKEEITEWLEEGIRQEELDLFNVRIDKRSNRIIYPVRDIDGRLINIKARTRHKNYKQLKLPKYINYKTIGDMDYFQGLDITLPYVKENDEIIIFESIKSVMKAYGWGYKNCVSAEKHNLTDSQIILLIKLGVSVVFAYDTDVNYKQKDIKRDINKLKRFTNLYLIDNKDKDLGGEKTKNSPADVGYETFKRLYETKTKVR